MADDGRMVDMVAGMGRSADAETRVLAVRRGWRDDALLTDPDWRVRAEAAIMNLGTEVLAGDPSAEVRCAVAYSDAGRDWLETLAHDPCDAVRAAVASQGADWARRLADDPSALVRMAAERADGREDICGRCRRFGEGDFCDLRYRTMGYYDSCSSWEPRGAACAAAGC